MKVADGHPTEPGTAQGKLKAYEQRPAPAAQAGKVDARQVERALPQDKLTLSAKFTEVARARERLREIEAHHESRVSQVGEAIRRGVYRVGGEQVARKLLGGLPERGGRDR